MIQNVVSKSFVEKLKDFFFLRKFLRIFMSDFQMRKEGQGYRKGGRGGNGRMAMARKSFESLLVWEQKSISGL